MGNIYIETDENFRVTKVHNMPLDPVNGMGYTREELERKGYFVDEIPTPVNKTGRRAVKMYNPDTKSVYYEYVGVPMSDKERADQLENALNAIITTFMGIIPATMSLDDEEQKTPDTLNNIADYLAYQIISGKLEVEYCFNYFPQFQDRIKETLMENGIQV